MALSATHHFIVRDLFKRGLLPKNGALLEIGEANWYHNIDPLVLATDIEEFVSDPLRRAALTERLGRILGEQPPNFSFDLVKIFYEIYFAPCETQAIDFDGTPHAQRLDLNEPIVLNRRFEVVINHGTSEHIFDIAQVFRTIHDLTVPRGLMIHESPLTGWIDHGFYNLQPTLFFDLAAANQYSLIMFIEQLADKSITPINSREDVYELARSKKIPDNAMLFTVMKKNAEESPFQVPIQGYYRGVLPPSGVAAWNDLR